MSASPYGNDLELTRFKDAREFANLVTPSMMGREAANCLQLGLLSGMLAGNFVGPYLAVVSRSGAEHAPLLNVIQTPPYRLILGEPAEPAEPAAAEEQHDAPLAQHLTPHATPHLAPHLAELLAPLLATLPADLPGVLGPVGLSALFAERYAALHGLRSTLVMSERVHQCQHVTLPAGVKGRMLRASPEHHNLLVRWWRAFSEEAVPNEPDRAEESVKRDLHATVGGLYVWEVDGEIVSFAGARGPTPNGIRIGPVYTPPEKRRNGYAAALVGGLTQKLLNEGKQFVFLFTNLANPTANALYRRLGYEGVADRSMYDFSA